MWRRVRSGLASIWRHFIAMPRPAGVTRKTSLTSQDWRKAEAKLNAVPQFTTEIDGIAIHFIHVKSRHENALPSILNFWL